VRQRSRIGHIFVYFLWLWPDISVAAYRNAAVKSVGIIIRLQYCPAGLELSKLLQGCITIKVEIDCISAC